MFNLTGSTYIANRPVLQNSSQSLAQPWDELHASNRLRTILSIFWSFWYRAPLSSSTHDYRITLFTWSLANGRNIENFEVVDLLEVVWLSYLNSF